jgi:hypothetical protein
MNGNIDPGKKFAGKWIQQQEAGESAKPITYVN